MKKISVIIAIIVCFFSCKENNSKIETRAVDKDSNIGTIKFPVAKESCEKTKYLFDAIPHFDKIEDYNFEGIECFGNGIGATYNHPTNKYYEIKVFIYEEKSDNKPMHTMSTGSFEMSSVAKVNGTEVSDLKIFDNVVLTIEKNPEYYDIQYNATFKKNFTVMIGIRGKDLSNKQKVDDFLKKYLEAFKKDNLK